MTYNVFGGTLNLAQFNPGVSQLALTHLWLWCSPTKLGPNDEERQTGNHTLLSLLTESHMCNHVQVCCILRPCPVCPSDASVLLKQVEQIRLFFGTEVILGLAYIVLKGNF